MFRRSGEKLAQEAPWMQEFRQEVLRRCGRGAPCPGVVSTLAWSRGLSYEEAMFVLRHKVADPSKRGTGRFTLVVSAPM